MINSRVLNMAENVGVYAIRVWGEKGPIDLLYKNLKHCIFEEDGSIWYVVNNNENVIQLVERWIHIPTHSVLAICFNETKPGHDPGKSST